MVDLKRFFPIKARSLDEFIEFVGDCNEGCVTGKPNVRIKQGRIDKLLGIIGNFEYSARFRLDRIDGRPVVFDQVYCSRFGTEYSALDAETRSEYELRSLITTREILDDVKRRYKEVETRLLSSVDEVTLRRMYNHAVQNKIDPFEYKITKKGRVTPIKRFYLES